MQSVFEYKIARSSKNAARNRVSNALIKKKNKKNAPKKKKNNNHSEQKVYQKEMQTIEKSISNTFFNKCTTFY